MYVLVRRGLAWLTLLGLLACAAYGLIHYRLFRQDVWTPTGLKRFVIFAAIYAVVFAAASLWKPVWFPSAAALLVLLYTAAAAGPVAVFAVTLVLLSSFALGELFLARGASPANYSVSDFVLALLLGLSAYMFAVSIAAAFPVNYWLVYLAVLTIPVVCNRRALRLLFAAIPRVARPRSLSWPERLASGALIFVLLSHWLVSLQPEVGPDALAMHLVVPGAIAVSHRWSFDVTQHLWAVMPMGGDWCFTLLYLLGGEAAARLFNLALLLCIAALLFAEMRRWLTRGLALFLVALFASTPLVQLATGSLFVENLWASLCFGALISIDTYRRHGNPRFLYTAYLLLGAAAASKFGALAFLAPLGAISLWVLASRPATPRFRYAITALLCFLIFAAPPYISSFVKTGSPVFPYLTKTFPSRYPDLAAGAGTPPPGPPLGWTTPFDLTFRTNLFHEVQDGATGFQYFVLLPLAVLLLRRKWPPLALASGFTAAVFAVLTLVIEQDVRYVYPALAPATLFIAGAFASLQRVETPLYRFAIATSIAIFALDLYFLPSSNWMHKDFVLNPASSKARLEYLTAYAPERNLVAYFNRTHPGAPVAFFESNAIAGLDARSQTTSWHTVEFYRRILNAAAPEEYFRTLNEYGLGFIIAPRPNTAALITTTVEEAFLESCVAPESLSGNYFAGRVKSCCQAHQPAVAPAGEYDDPDPHIEYTGLWFRGRFAPASRGTVTFSSAPGAALTLRFTGTEVIYVYTKAFNRGIAEILLDRASQGTLDLYSSSIEWQTATPFRAPSSGQHILEIRVTGRRNAASTGVFVDADSLVVR
ncbi:MAG TPA: hypothetical protein VKX49_18250 [Bryobacteraceae bacterium]|nr:hypothetical protein [Bryobacteraceae bacterium]